MRPKPKLGTHADDIYPRSPTYQHPRSAAVACGSEPSRSGLPIEPTLAHSSEMGTKSRESIFGSSIRHSAERAAEARKEADRLACVAWNQRMLGFKAPAQPSPALGDTLNAGYLYLEVRWILRSAVLAATRTKPLRWTSSASRRRRPSMNHG